MRNKHMTIRVSSDEHKRLLALAQRLELSKSEVIRNALDMLAGRVEMTSDDPHALMKCVRENRSAIAALDAINDRMMDSVEADLRLSRGAPKGRSDRVKAADEWADEHKREIERA